MLSRGQGPVLATLSIVPTMPSETPTSYWLSWGRQGCASHKNGAETLIARCYPQSTGRPMPMADALFTERAADHGLRCWRQQRPLRARLPLDRVNVAQREGRAYRRCGSSTRQDVVKVPRDCRTSLARVTKTRSQVAITVRPIMPNARVCSALSDRLVSLREGASAVSLCRSVA
jgi:hypothetical protein